MFVSEALALSAAACIALSGMLISELKGRVDVLRLARWQMLAAFAMTAGATTLLGAWDTIETSDLVALTLSSLFGIIIASTTYFAAIYAAGPRTTALLFTLASPFSLLLGYAVLDETISLRQGLGVMLVLAGILLAIGPRRRETVTAVEVTAGTDSKINSPSPLPSPRERRGEGGANLGPSIVNFGVNDDDRPLPVFHGERVRVRGSQIASTAGWIGIALGVITALGQALGSLFARPAMEAGVDPAAAMAVRSGVAAIFFLLLALVPLPALRRPYRFKRQDLGIAIASAFFGTGLGMSLLMGALATGNVGIVTTLSSMTPIMILPMVWARSGVAPVRVAWLGAGLAVAGTALISL